MLNIKAGQSGKACKNRIPFHSFSVYLAVYTYLQPNLIYPIGKPQGRERFGCFTILVIWVRMEKMCGSAFVHYWKVVFAKWVSIDSPALASRVFEDYIRPCFAQGQPSKPQCSVYRNGDEADQRDRLNDAGFTLDLEVVVGHILAYQIMPSLSCASFYWKYSNNE